MARLVDMADRGQAPRPRGTRVTRAWHRTGPTDAIPHAGHRTAPGDTMMSPHVLRHTFATLSRDAGSRLEDIQDALDHADPRTTRR
ncbi:hypothetical protein BG844_24905 [Couchioplanes caeruleus subsp. caeruleus]|uniref:Tyr recombinase domain-containing protein n=1 Tax=Couchioplanes caeruleus subsp. caeruleus TaxID=56427 RepID=A0A1K0FFR6_9ACTN|nr:hypothetical protein BG844_24905 [Couchioplanes caeruleus subsp. caeruleus]